MIALFFSNPIAFLIIFPGLLMSLAIHEFAHAFTADQLGDPTPRYQGRVTLDPRAHLDLLGVAALLLTRFGWGKPVEFDPYNLKHPVRDTALIALAGPVSNIIIAVILAMILRSGFIPNLLINVSLAQILFINLMLAVFNLVPIHPLDGSKILFALLPKGLALEYEQLMRQYGLIILLALIFPWSNGASPISALISPVLTFLITLFLPS